MGVEMFTLVGHSNWIVDIKFSPDGTQLCSALWDKMVKLWNIKSGDKDPMKTMPTGERPVNTCTFSLDDKRVVVGTWDGKIKEDGVIIIWNEDSRESILTIHGHNRHCHILLMDISTHF